MKSPLCLADRRRRRNSATVTAVAAIAATAIFRDQSHSAVETFTLPSPPSSVVLKCPLVRPLTRPRPSRRFATSIAAEASNENRMTPKLETAAVERFTKGYDKLCKSCPARLRPRVDTLCEMILGLSDVERSELLETVERRVEETWRPRMEEEGVWGNSRVEAKTPREVYDFQVGLHDASLVRAKDKRKENGTMMTKAATDATGGRREEVLSKSIDSERQDDLTAKEEKLVSKITKSRSKLENLRLELSRTDRLLSITSILQSDGPNAALPTAVAGANECTTVIDGLRAMNSQGLKLEWLKYESAKAKCEQKMAKMRVKIFAANLELSRLHALRMEREQD